MGILFPGLSLIDVAKERTKIDPRGRQVLVHNTERLYSSSITRFACVYRALHILGHYHTNNPSCNLHASRAASSWLPLSPVSPSLSHWFKMPCAFMHSCPTLMDLTHPISAVYTSYKREVKLLPVVCHSSDSVTVFRCILCSSLEFRLGLTRPLACVLYHCEARIQDDYMKAAVLISRSQPISLPIPALYSIPSPGHCLPKHLPSPASNACGFTSILLLLMLATLHTLQ